MAKTLLYINVGILFVCILDKNIINFMNFFKLIDSIYAIIALLNLNLNPLTFRDVPNNGH